MTFICSISNLDHFLDDYAKQVFAKNAEHHSRNRLNRYGQFFFVIELVSEDHSSHFSNMAIVSLISFHNHHFDQLLFDFGYSAICFLV